MNRFLEVNVLLITLLCTLVLQTNNIAFLKFTANIGNEHSSIIPFNLTSMVKQSADVYTVIISSKDGISVFCKNINGEYTSTGGIA